MMAAKTTVFSMAGCAFCAKAKGLLAGEKCPFADINIDLHPQRYTAAATASGIATVPVIYIGDGCVGGYDDLHKLHQTGAGALAKEINNAGAPTNAFLLPLTADELAMAQARRDAAATTKVDVAREFVIGNETISYGALVAEMADKLDIGDRGMFWCKKKTFMGENVVAWLSSRFAVTHVEAAAAGKELLHARVFSAYGSADSANNRDSVESGDVYRLQLHEYADQSLNTHRWHAAATVPGANLRSADETSAELRGQLGGILDRFLGDDGLVDYAGIAASDDFKQFVDASSVLQTVDLSTLSHDGKIAFGLNTYNMCILHAYATQGPPVGNIAMYRFFQNVGYNIGGLHYSLNQLENGFLRGNRMGVAAFSLPFGSDDPRKATMLPEPDNRIHFALNCGALSCPPIKVYSADDLDAQLERAALGFMESSATFDEASKTLRLSKILSWYKADFQPSVVDAAVKYVPSAMRDRCKAAGLENITVVYNEYDWTTNAKPRK
jgi:glutaredoxin